MSGPITVGFSFGPLGAVVLAALALNEAVAMGEEYADALEQVKQREAGLAATRRQQRESRLERHAALIGEIERGERRLGRLAGICSALGPDAPAPATPARPETGEEGALIAYANAVQQEIRRIESLLAHAGAGFQARLRASLGVAQDAPPQADLDEMLSFYATQRNLEAGLDPAQAEQFRETVARVLARVDPEAGGVMPLELETLARDIMLAPSLERAQSLALELRLRAQRHQENREARQREAEDARNLLDSLPDDIPAPLRARLEHIASGTGLFDPGLREAVQNLLAATQRDRERMEQEAAASVLEQSLRDLGFEVEGVENTLFVEGGMVHFQRPGWENYFVRLRLDPREQTLNFNVVRPRGVEDNAEQRRLDTLAEDRWCSEFPRLMKTLEARGMLLKVTRQLGAGELPVQAVDPATLPQARSEEEHSRAHTAPLHMKHP